MKKSLHLKNILSILRKGKHAGQSQESVSRLWLWVVSSALVVTLIFLAIGSFMFFRVQKEGPTTSSGDEVEGVATIDRDELESMLELLSVQKQRFDSIQTSNPTIVDPSR